MRCNNLVYKCIFKEIKLNFKSSLHVSYGLFFILFSIGAIFGGIEPIQDSLSPVVSGYASNVEDDNSCMHSQSFVSDIFSTTQFCITVENICLYLRFPSFVVA